MSFIIVEGCTKDEKCVEVCPVDCIHPRKDEAQFEEVAQLFIDPVNCIDCGACVPVCPTNSIYAETDLPENFAEYTEKNAQHFQ